MGNRAWRMKIRRWMSSAIWSQLAYFALAFGRTRAPAVAPDTSIVEVRDRGSDLTIICFAGLAALHGGMVSFEFTNLLRRQGLNANLVFVRDPNCSCYHLAPDGSKDGLGYYEKRLRAVLEKLGSRYHVAVGTSVGGMAATLFGQRLGVDQVIAFSPSWPPQRYMIHGGLRAHLRLLTKLLAQPAAYLERLVVAQMARFAHRYLQATVGEGGIVNLETELAGNGQRPKIAVYYGEGCEPDVETAGALARLAGAETVALPTSMHNTTAFIRTREDVVSLIRDRVDAAMNARGVVPKRRTAAQADEVSVLVAGIAS